jgi:aminopeptidase N
LGKAERGEHASGGNDTAFAPPDTADHRPKERAFRLHHLRLEIAIDDKGKGLAGTAILRLSPVNEGLKRIELDAFELNVSSVKEGGGKALDFDLHGETLTVHLGRARKADVEFELRIRYACHPRKGLFFTGPDEAYPTKPRVVWSQGEEMDNRAWFPSYDYPNQRFTSELVVTVQEKLTVVANGHLVGEKRDSRRKLRTFHWLQDKPHANYLIALVAGEWDVKEWDADGIRVQAYVPKGRGKEIDLCFSRVPEMVTFFGRVTGLKFPWDKYAQVVVPEFIPVGMENTSMTILHEYVLTDDRAYPDYSSDSLLSHELAHQWFGDWITCKSWAHIWLNESFAEYAECLWYEDHYGKDAALMLLEEIRQAYYEEAEKQYIRPIVTHTFVDVADMFDKHTYNKGCGVLHMLRTVLGDDLWWKGIRNYVGKHGLQNVETTDFKVALEEATGKSLDWFFDEWLYHAGHPEFEVSWSYDDTAKQVEVKVRQTQAVKDAVPRFRMPVVLEFATERRVWRETVQVDAAEHTFRIASRDRPKMALFDPDGALLMRLTFAKGKEELLWQLAHARSAWGRIEAAHGLSRFVGDGAVVDALGAAWGKEKFWGVRRQMAATLGEIGTPAARDILLRSTGDRESRVRSAVYRALGKFRRDDEAFRALQKGYRDDPKYYPAAAAGAALAETRHEGAFDALVKGMDRPSQSEVLARSAVDGIADLRDARGLGVLEARTQYGRPELVRARAATALGRLAFYHERDQGDVCRALAALLRDPNCTTRFGAIDGLAALGSRQAEEELERVRDSDPMGSMRRGARRGIGELRDRRKAFAKRLEQQDELDKLKDKNKELASRLTTLEASVADLAGRRRGGRRPRPRRT